MNSDLPIDLMPYPLPPWRHRFRTLSVFCQVDEAAIAQRIPAPLELNSDIVQVTVMHFESTVPDRPYYDSAVIAQVRLGNDIGGHWAHAFTSTDQVLAGTRELWGYNMKLADIDLHVDEPRIWGSTTRLGRRVIDIDMTPTGTPFEVPNMFPRLFVKAIPHSEKPVALAREVVMMVADTEVTQTVWGQADLRLGESAHDPVHRLKPKQILGASYMAGEQVLNWGKVVG